MDEPTLINEALHGNLESFNELVLTHQERMYNHALRMLDDSSAAADATQDAFIQAYRKLNTFRGSSFKAWLFRILTNRCYDELRKRKRNPSVSLEIQGDDDQEIEDAQWMKDPASGPEEVFEQRELWNAVQSCLNKLNPEFKAVILLIDIQEMDYCEAAETMNCAVGTIKSRLARARSSVRTCLRSVKELLPSFLRLGSEGIS